MKGREGAAPWGRAETHTSGGVEYIAGDGTDKLFGATAVTYKLNVSANPAGTYKVTSKRVVLYTATGELSGTGSATLIVGAKGSATITDGKINLTKGTGALKGHSLVGTFTGSGNAVSGTYVFHYKGTYK